jgi:hypothetical protein
MSKKKELKDLLNQAESLEKGFGSAALLAAHLTLGAGGSTPPQKPVGEVNKPTINAINAPGQSKIKPAAMAAPVKPKFLQTNSENEPDTFEAEPQFKPEGLNDDLKAISINETQYGSNMNHAKNLTDWNTAHGPVGLKPMVAFDTYKNSQRLQGKYTDIASKTDFIKKFKSDPDFYNELGRSTWSGNLNETQNPDVTAYGWRHGINKAKQDFAKDPDLIANDPYVQAWKKSKLEKPWLKKKPQANPSISPALQAGFDKIAQQLGIKKSELEKIQSAPKWAGLLGTAHSPKGDDRRDTPIIGPISTRTITPDPAGGKPTIVDNEKKLNDFQIPGDEDYRALGNKHAQAYLGVPNQEEQINTGKKIPEKALESAWGIRQPTTGYALNEDMRAAAIREKYNLDLENGKKPDPKTYERALNRIKDPNDVIGTKLHENSHAMDARLWGIKTPEGVRMARPHIQNIQRNLLDMAYKSMEKEGIQGIPEFKQAMDKEQRSYSDNPPDEYYAKILNILNSSGQRNAFKDYLPPYVRSDLDRSILTQTPENKRFDKAKELENMHYQKYFTVAKKLHRRFNEMANKVQPHHLSQLTIPGASEHFEFEEPEPKTEEFEIPQNEFDQLNRSESIEFEGWEK